MGKKFMAQAGGIMSIGWRSVVGDDSWWEFENEDFHCVIIRVPGYYQVDMMRKGKEGESWVVDTVEEGKEKFQEFMEGFDGT